MDSYGALLDEDFPPVRGSATGTLAGLTFVAKDLFAVQGRVTGAGQPTWAATHEPAGTNAPAVQRLLDAGATLVGRSHTAEMAYSLSGRDSPYGMPINPTAPDHDPGGSSSGSAAAIAGGLADLGLGSDTLGSIRVPASYGGIYGWRPTHGLVPLDGVHPLAPSLDTVGLLARDPVALRAAAAVLAARPLAEDSPSFRDRKRDVEHPDSGHRTGEGGRGRVLVAAEAFALLDPATAAALREVVDSFAPTGSIDLVPREQTMAGLTVVVRDVQGPEFAAAHRAWIEAAGPTFGPGVGERIAHALQVAPEAQAAANEVRTALRAHLATALGPGDVVLAPAAGRPPRRDAGEVTVADARRVAASLSVVASLAGLPTVTIPAVVVDGVTVGLSLIGPPGGDGRLLSRAEARPPVPSATGPGSP